MDGVDGKTGVDDREVVEGVRRVCDETRRVHSREE